MKWYELMYVSDLEDQSLVSKAYTYFLRELGEKEFLLTKGNYYSLAFDDIFITFGINDRTVNYNNEGTHAVSIISGKIWVGFLSED